MQNRTHIKISKRLCEARKALGLSQSEVADKLGRNQYFVSRCETGKRRLDICELEEFAKLYNKPISFFFE